MISEAKALAAIPAAASLEAGVLADMIERAVAFIERQTRRYFGLPETVTEYLMGTCRYDLYLSERPQSVDSDPALVTVIERCLPSTTIGEVTDFEVRECDTYRAVLHRTDGAVWGSGYEYAVTYIRGYEIDAGPGDIESLILDLIALRIRSVGQEGIQSETIGGYSYSRFANKDLESLPGSDLTLKAWRRSVLA